MAGSDSLIPSAEREGVQAAHGDHGPPGGACRQRGVLVVPGAQAGQVVGDVGGDDVLDSRPGRLGSASRRTGEVAPVRLKGVSGQPALDGKMIEIPADRCGHGGQLTQHPNSAPKPSRIQLSTSASGVTGDPCASATGPQVIAPSCVLSPGASDGSLRRASRQPYLAISMMYGRVTLVSA